MSARIRMLAGCSIAIAIVAAIALVNALNRPAPPPLIQGVLLSEARPLDPFNLIDHKERSFQNDDLEGRWHLVSYGFTTCPDICPTTLNQLATMTRSLAESGSAEDLQVLFYTVDHRRDTAQQMASYVSYFNPDFIGLTHVDDPQNPHLPFEKSLGIAAKLTPVIGPDVNPADNQYEVSHGVTLFLLNPAGQLQAIFEPDRLPGGGHSFDPNKLLRDYLAVRRHLG